MNESELVSLDGKSVINILKSKEAIVTIGLSLVTIIAIIFDCSPSKFHEFLSIKEEVKQSMQNPVSEVSPDSAEEKEHPNIEHRIMEHPPFPSHLESGFLEVPAYDELDRRRRISLGLRVLYES